MAAITLESTGSLGAAKFHIYAAPATAAPADFKKATIDAILAAASQFLKVDAEFEQSVSKGEVIAMANGSKLVTTSEVAGNIKAYGLSPVDYAALMNTTTGYNLKDIDLFFLQAPTDQAAGTCTIGQYFFQVYSVNAYVTMELKSGIPNAVGIAWERTDSSDEIGTAYDIIAADA